MKSSGSERCPRAGWRWLWSGLSAGHLSPQKSWNLPWASVAQTMMPWSVTMVWSHTRGQSGLQQPLVPCWGGKYITFRPMLPVGQKSRCKCRCALCCPPHAHFHAHMQPLRRFSTDPGPASMALTLVNPCSSVGPRLPVLGNRLQLKNTFGVINSVRWLQNWSQAPRWSKVAAWSSGANWINLYLECISL